MWNAIGQFFVGDAPERTPGRPSPSQMRTSARGPYSASLTAFSVLNLENKEYLNDGDKLILPTSSLASLSMLNVTWPMTFKVVNTYTQRVIHAGVQEFSAEEGTCYMPLWMMENLLLREGDIIHLENLTLPKGNIVKLQPCSKTFVYIDDHQSFLEMSMSRFSCLTVGELLPVKHDNTVYEIEVLELTPGPAVCIIECDLKVEFAPPKDWTEEDDHPRQFVADTTNDSASVDPMPWQKAIINGVRKYDHGFNRMVQEGRVPGVIKDMKLSESEYAKKAFHGAGKSLGSKC
eukprot:GHVH01001302.1.p1 GENE.GHVH01001302.1~~GHVH01001302.1.p1  ORF type:complete len:290 (+),score=38.55 GHVH01001302.1:801-1670(+)